MFQCQSRLQYLISQVEFMRPPGVCGRAQQPRSRRVAAMRVRLVIYYESASTLKFLEFQ